MEHLKRRFARAAAEHLISRHGKDAAFEKVMAAARDLPVGDRALHLDILNAMREVDEEEADGDGRPKPAAARDAAAR